MREGGGGEREKKRQRETESQRQRDREREREREKEYICVYLPPTSKTGSRGYIGMFIQFITSQTEPPPTPAIVLAPV